VTSAHSIFRWGIVGASQIDSSVADDLNRLAGAELYSVASRLKSSATAKEEGLFCMEAIRTKT